QVHLLDAVHQRHRVAGVLVGPARPAPVRPPAHLVDGVVGAARDGDVDRDPPRALDDREAHTVGDRVDGRCERDGGEEALEAELALSPVMATPAASPISSKVPSPRLWKSREHPADPSNDHTTALTLWVLRVASGRPAVDGPLVSVPPESLAVCQ